MNCKLHIHLAARLVMLLILIFLFQEIAAGTSSQTYDYSHRKRDCEVRLVSNNGVPLAGALIGITLLSNDFVFGGAISGGAFDSLGYEYEERFLSYFDCGTPENEMKWENVMKCSEMCDPDFSKADSLVNWMLKNNISICGNNLFSNEKEEWIPEWTRNLGSTPFRQAMQDRIYTTTDHFKGKIDQWNLISEICHGENGSYLTSGILQTKSGDPDIFNWILDEARKKDNEAKFIINDCGLITSSEQTTADQFVSMVKPLKNKFDIIGAQSHFNEYMDRSSYEPKINYLAEQTEKTVWLTDIEFDVDTSQAADKIEELMRSCFANPKVGGLIMGSWLKDHQAPGNLTSYFVNSMNNETPVGQRWREVRSEWKTEIGGYTDDSGKISFTGFQGKYLVLVSCYLDTFYLEPGEGTKTVEVVYYPVNTVDRKSTKTAEFFINGKSAIVKLPAGFNRQLFLTTYSLSGKQLSRSPVNITGGNLRVPPTSSCRVFRIETADGQPLYAGKLMTVR